MSYRELKQHGTEDFPIAFYHIDKNHTRFEMASHWHSHIEIIRIISGELNIKLYNNEYIATAGDVVFVNSETVHGDVYFIHHLAVEQVDGAGSITGIAL